MGFIINEEGRQHTSLSEKAMKTIESDMIRFNDDYELKNKSGFMNLIISNYYDSFPLARKVILKQVNEIKKAISGDEFSSKLTKKVIDLFSSEITKTLIKEHAGIYSNDCDFKLKLNKNNIQLLATIEDSHYFYDYAPRSDVGFYLKIILESYARLNKEERQKIYFKKAHDDLTRAVSERRLIAIQKGKKLEKYEIGSFSKPADKEFYELEYYVVSEDSIIIDTIKLKDFSKTNYRVLEERQERVLTTTHQFLNEKDFSVPKTDFIVEFTSAGLDRFLYEEDKLPIIGIPSKDDEYRFTFKAIEAEIFFHLFKFGSQAKIIKPLEIQSIFKELYKQAYEKYNE